MATRGQDRGQKHSSVAAVCCPDTVQTPPGRRLDIENVRTPPGHRNAARTTPGLWCHGLDFGAMAWTLDNARSPPERRLDTKLEAEFRSPAFSRN